MARLEVLAVAGVRRVFAAAAPALILSGVVNCSVGDVMGEG